ncbi:MAG TPA: type II secretion system protein [Candidatus Sulfotelmatobacter sp.]|nr:type II secretion system protein [Candidatus Sulfotelmatobacter sp.]
MKKIKNSQKGYTLVELLAVIFILVSVGGIITSILITSLRGSNRVTTVNEVRQNGNYIIGQMSKMISYARNFDGVSTDGINYTTDCTVQIPPSPTPTPEPVSYSYIKITSFDGGDTVFSCSPNAIASNGADLIYTANLNVSSCNIYCSQEGISGTPVINIQFTLTKINSGLFVENQTTIPFDTSVVLRN